MAEEQAVNDASATSEEVVETPEVETEERAAETAESATAKEDEQEGATEETEKPGSEPEKPLGGKGKAEVITLRRRAQEAEERARKLELENAEQRGRLSAFKEMGRAPGSPESTTPELTEERFAQEFEQRNPRPDEDDPKFTSNAAFTEALAQWAVDKKIYARDELNKARDAASRKISEDATRQKAEDAAITQARAQINRGIEKFGDEFNDAAKAINSMGSYDIINALYDSPVGEDIAWYLGNNPKERERISKLSPTRQITEIGVLEAGIRSGNIKVKAGVEAPPPPPPPRVQTGGRAHIPVDESKLTDAEWIKRRREQKATNSSA